MIFFDTKKQKSWLYSIESTSNQRFYTKKWYKTFIVESLLSFGIFENIDDRITSEEHFWNVATFCDCCAFFTFSGHFSPDFLNVFHNHIHVSIEGLNLAQQFLVISQSDQYFVVCLYWFSQKWKRSHIKRLLLSSMHRFFFLHPFQWYAL